MPWKCGERLRDLNIRSQYTGNAYRNGYSDGFHGYPLDSGDYKDRELKVYLLGHRHGKIDKAAK